MVFQLIKNKERRRRKTNNLVPCLVKYSRQERDDLSLTISLLLSIFHRESTMVAVAAWAREPVKAIYLDFLFYTVPYNRLDFRGF